MSRVVESVQDYVAKASACALGILKPSKRDLEHGLELHKEATVVEAYGFGPKGRDPRRVLDAIRGGLTGHRLSDARESSTMITFMEDPRQLEDYRELWNASGVDCVFVNSAETDQDPLRMMRRFSYYTAVTDKYSDIVAKAAYPEDVIKAKKAGKPSLVLTCTGVPLTQRWQSVEDEFRFIYYYANLGCRMMHLTYNRGNMLGSGCGETTNAGLSDLGRGAIAAMNKAGVIIDVSHCGWRTALEAAEASTKPIVASHTSCAALWDHIRSKPDNVMKAIADRGGLFGVVAMPAFLGGTGDISAMLDHMSYAIKTIGSEHVGIGTDVSGHTSLTQEQLDLQKEIEREYPHHLTRTYRLLWPKNDPLRSPDWNKPEQKLSLSWVNFPFITVGLVQRGFSDEQIMQVLGGNMLRVFGDVVQGEQFVP